jgi:hypothetical protein
MTAPFRKSKACRNARRFLPQTIHLVAQYDEYQVAQGYALTEASPEGHRYASTKSSPPERH